MSDYFGNAWQFGQDARAVVNRQRTATSDLSDADLAAARDAAAHDATQRGVTKLEDSPEWTAARDSLVERHLLLAYHVASKLRRDSDVDDLISVCNVELIKAAERFNPAIGKFSTYAIDRLEKAVRQHRRQARIVSIPSEVATEKRALTLATTAFVTVAEREPTNAELSRLTGFTTDKVQFVLTRANIGEVSIDALMPETTRPSTNALFDRLVAATGRVGTEPDTTLDGQYEAEDTNHTLAQVRERAQLSDLDWDIIRRSFGIGCSHVMPDYDIAHVLGLKQRTVRGRRQRAMAQLKAAAET